MIDISWRAFALPLKHPFTIARGTVEVQETLVVQLHEAGEFGYGAARAQQRDRPARLPREPEREEAGGTLVQHRDRFQAGVCRRRQRHRSRTRTG